MVDVDKAEALAELKHEIKLMEEKARQLQKELLDAGAAHKIKTSYGTLSLTERTNMECPDKGAAFEALGKDNFMAISSPSFSKAKTLLGTGKADDLLEEGIFSVKSISTYYTLRK